MVEAAPTFEADTQTWRDFHAVAIRFPDCEGVRLVKSMQRAFIAHQQAQIARDIVDALDASRAEPAAAEREIPESPAAPDAALDRTTTA